MLAPGAFGFINATASAERRLSNIEVYVAPGARLSFEGGKVYASLNTNISVAGHLVIGSNGKPAYLDPSVAELGFDVTNDAVLNDKLTTNWSLPAYGAVDDLVALDSVHPHLRDKMYDLDPETEATARDVYVRAGESYFG